MIITEPSKGMESQIIYIGVDPGKSGFITTFDGKEFRFYAMPTHKVDTGEITKTGKPKMKTEFHEYGMFELALKIKEEHPAGCHFKVAIEQVTGRTGWSAQNNFNFGYTAGMQKMIMLFLTPHPILMVRPQKWQTYMRQGYPSLKKASSTGKTQVQDPKAVAEMIVNKEYPNIDFRKTLRSRVNCEDKIDSFLICMYLFRTSN